MIRLAAILVAAVLLPALPAHARLLDDQHEHDGFFLRFHLGGGGLDAKWSGAGERLSVGGPSAAFSFALGGAIAPNLILFGEFTNELTSNPRARIGSMSYSTRDASFAMVGFGPGLAYYFMPVNLYLSGTLLMTQATLSEGPFSTTSDRGLGLKMALGKEWWVSRDWGLGIAAVATIANMKHEAATLDTTNFGLAFSATYN